MFIKEISIQNFRNILPASLHLAKGFWVVLGRNGQGKSNFLEAIGTACVGQSRRTERERELICLGKDWLRLEANIVREERGPVELKMKLSQNGKELMAAGTPVPRLAKYMAEASCVSFSPDDVGIVLGEPSRRRQFMNESVSLISQGYIYDLGRYRRVLEQKNKALKAVREGVSSEEQLDIWDKQISNYGGRVCARRARFVRQIGGLAEGLYSEISGGGEPFSLSYEPTVPAPESAEQWPAVLADAIHARRQDEITRGVALIGPQRDDLKITINEMDARSFASRGQARSAALAFRLAQAQLTFDLTQEWPVLLMDDVFSELDSSRREVLGNLAARAEQALATAAAETELPGMDSGWAGRIVLEQGCLSVEPHQNAV